MIEKDHRFGYNWISLPALNITRMAIPDYQTLMHPLLQFLADDKEHEMKETIDHLADKFGLSSADRQRTLHCYGKERIIWNDFSSARMCLKQARLIEYVRRDCIRISERGKAVLTEKPESIDVHYLERFPEFVSFSNRMEKQKIVYSWRQVNAVRRNTEFQRHHSAGKAKKKYLEWAVPCPKCNMAAEHLSRFYFYTSKESRERLAGRTGWVTVCDKCKIQVDFFIEIIS